jgi:glycosyltransferase involved in cell wall biosynthesis
MSIGIYTHYSQCDQTYFAIRLANFLRDVGESFSIYSDSAPAKLKTVYDNRIYHKEKIKYTEWAKRHDFIIWTHVPKIEQISFAKRHKVTTILVPMWQDLITPFRKSIKNADHVVALSTECRELYQSVYKFKHVNLIPFDTGLPITKKESLVNPRAIKVFLPWFDRNARCTQVDFLTHIGFLLTRMEEMQLTVGISSSKFAPSVAKFFQTLGEKTKRVHLLRNVKINARPAVYGAHDLTIFPAECDNYGFCSLTSVTCGTPVLTFAVGPQTDFIYQDSNGVAVRTKVDYDENGVPHASPDYELYMAALQTLIAEPQHIEAMNRKVNYNLNTRRKSFEVGWKTLLRLA